MLDAAANLKVVGRAGIGIDNVDIGAATKRGVIVMNTPHGNSVTTAEHAITMILPLRVKSLKQTHQQKLENGKNLVLWEPKLREKHWA